MTTRARDDMDELIDGASVAELSRVLVRARKRMRALAVDSNPMLQGAVLDPLIGYMIKTHSMHALTKLVKACALLGPNMAEMIGTLLGSEGRCKLLMGPSLRRVETIVLAKAHLLNYPRISGVAMTAFVTPFRSNTISCALHASVFPSSRHVVAEIMRAGRDSKHDCQLKLYVQAFFGENYNAPPIVVVVSIPVKRQTSWGPVDIGAHELGQMIIDASGYGHLQNLCNSTMPTWT